MVYDLGNPRGGGHPASWDQDLPSGVNPPNETCDEVKVPLRRRTAIKYSYKLLASVRGS